MERKIKEKEEQGIECKNMFSLANLRALTTSTDPASDCAGRDSAEQNDEPSRLADIRILTSADCSSSTSDDDDFVSMAACSYSSMPPIFKPGIRAATKVGIVAGCVVFLAAFVIVSVIAVFRSGEVNDRGELLKALRNQIALADRVDALQNQIVRMQSKSTAELSQIKALISNGDFQDTMPETSPAAVREKREESEAATVENQADEPVPTGEKAKAANPPSPSRQVKSAPAKPKSPGPVFDFTGVDSKNTASVEDEILGAPTKEPAKSDDILDDLLKPSVNGTAATKKESDIEKASNGASVPGSRQKLGRSEVQEGMSEIAARVEACGEGDTGTIMLKVVIGTEGHVIAAKATGSFAGTIVGSCAAAAARTAKFPKSRESTTVSYAFNL